MIEVPKVSCRYPEEWREISGDVEEILGAMGASWYQDFPDNLHRISSNPDISESIRGAVKSYKRIRRDRFENRLEQKNSSYSREQDALLADVKDYLDDDVELRRAEIGDAYGEKELPEDRVLLPRDERDIVAELDDGVDLDEMINAAESLDLEPSRVYEDDLWHGDEHMAVILPRTGDSAEARRGMSVSIYPDDEIYIIGGGNGEREGVDHRGSVNPYQPFYKEDASWNIRLFDSYLQHVKDDEV
jgi:hypothetical protein